MNETIARMEKRTGSREELFEDVRTLLTCPGSEFEEAKILARATADRVFGSEVYVTGLLAFSNICRNDCTYCGLRVSNTAIPRMRLAADDINRAVDRFRETGLDRVFLVSGEDTSYTADDIARVVAHAKSLGFHVTLGLGELSETELATLRDAGCDCFTLKFETSNRDVFKACKSSSDYDARMDCIRRVKSLGMELGSGNIIGLEGQSVDDIARDIVLMDELSIDWAPVVPYLPAPGTPMAAHTPMGDVSLLLREIAILRILMPRTIITAGQPRQGSKLGFADPDGNRDAIGYGANILFVDITPHALRKDFQIAPGRILPGVAHVDALLEGIGMKRASS